MDAEFVEFLDKKFQRVELRFDRIEEQMGDLGKRIARLEASVERLTTQIDRMLKMWEDLNVEQKSIIADLNRIKAVLKEKLGVEL